MTLSILYICACGIGIERTWPRLQMRSRWTVLCCPPAFSLRGGECAARNKARYYESKFHDLGIW